MKTLIAIVLIAGVMSAGCFVNISSYTAPDGSTIYVGDYYNDQEGPGFGPGQVQGKLYDASGNLIDTAGGFLCLGVEPRGLIPFKAWTGPTAPPASMTWTVVDPPMNPLLATGIDAKVTNTFVAGALTYIVGELTNTSANVYVASSVCVSFTDAAGRVVRSNWNNGGAWRFNPGDTLPFSVPIDSPPPGSDIHFYTDAQVNNPGAAVDLPNNALSHAFQQTAQQGDLFVTTGMGEVRNASDKPLYPDTVATIRNTSGTLLASRGDPSDCGVTIAPHASGFVSYTVKARVNARPKVQLQGFQSGTPVYFPKVNDAAFKADGSARTITVTGTITNTSAVVLRSADVCAGGYDVNGVVRTLGSIRLELPTEGLAAGATTPFKITMSDGGGVRRVTAIADGFAE